MNFLYKSIIYSATLAVFACVLVSSATHAEEIIQSENQTAPEPQTTLAAAITVTASPAPALQVEIPSVVTLAFSENVTTTNLATAVTGCVTGTTNPAVTNITAGTTTTFTITPTSTVACVVTVSGTVTPATAGNTFATPTTANVAASKTLHPIPAKPKIILTDTFVSAGSVNESQRTTQKTDAITSNPNIKIEADSTATKVEYSLSTTTPRTWVEITKASDEYAIGNEIFSDGENTIYVRQTNSAGTSVEESKRFTYYKNANTIKILRGSNDTELPMGENTDNTFYADPVIKVSSDRPGYFLLLEKTLGSCRNANVSTTPTGAELDAYRVIAIKMLAPNATPQPAYSALTGTTTPKSAEVDGVVSGLIAANRIQPNTRWANNNIDSFPVLTKDASGKYVAAFTLQQTGAVVNNVVQWQTVQEKKYDCMLYFIDNAGTAAANHLQPFTFTVVYKPTVSVTANPPLKVGQQSTVTLTFSKDVVNDAYEIVRKGCVVESRSNPDADSNFAITTGATEKVRTFTMTPTSINDCVFVISGFKMKDAPNAVMTSTEKTMTPTTDATTLKIFQVAQPNNSEITDSFITLARKTAGIIFSGTVQQGASVTVQVGSGSIKTATVTNGAWSAAFAAADFPTEGVMNIVVKTTLAGSTVADVVKSITVDFTPPVLTVGNAYSNNTTNNTKAMSGNVVTVPVYFNEALKLPTAAPTLVFANTMTGTMPTNQVCTSPAAVVTPTQWQSGQPIAATGGMYYFIDTSAGSGAYKIRYYRYIGTTPASVPLTTGSTAPVHTTGVVNGFNFEYQAPIANSVAALPNTIVHPFKSDCTFTVTSTMDGLLAGTISGTTNTDAAGNSVSQTPFTNQTFRVDTKAPSITGIQVKGSSSNPILSFTLSDSYPGERIIPIRTECLPSFSDGTSYGSSPTYVDLSVSAAVGTYSSCRIRFKDELGNEYPTLVPVTTFTVSQLVSNSSSNSGGGGGGGSSAPSVICAPGASCNGTPATPVTATPVVTQTPTTPTVAVTTPINTQSTPIVMIAKELLPQTAKSSDVKTLQALLTKLGYTVPVNGKYGPTTIALVKKYQKDRDIPQTGIVGKKTLLNLQNDALTAQVSQAVAPQSTPAPKEQALSPSLANVPILSNQISPSAASAADVATLQTILTTLGYSVPVNGKYGPTTTALVKKYQKDRGIPQTGSVGGITLKNLQYDILTLKAKALAAPVPSVVTPVTPTTPPVATQNSSPLTALPATPNTLTIRAPSI